MNDEVRTLIARNASRMETKSFNIGYKQAAVDLCQALEVEKRNFAIGRLKAMLERGETPGQLIEELTCEVCTLAPPLNLKREDRLSVDPENNKFVPYYLT